MKRNNINFIVDCAGFVVFCGLIFTGAVIRYILPPGTGGRGQQLNNGTGREQIKDLLTLTRYQWGDIHYTLSIVFIVIMIIHLLLHWNWIKNTCKTL
jgi:hypothetical protein